MMNCAEDSTDCGFRGECSGFPGDQAFGIGIGIGIGIEAVSAAAGHPAAQFTVGDSEYFFKLHGGEIAVFLIRAGGKQQGHRSVPGDGRTFPQKKSGAVISLHTVNDGLHRRGE